MNEEGGVKHEVIRKINLLSACTSTFNKPLHLSCISICQTCYQPCWDKEKESLKQEENFVLMKIIHINNFDTLLCPFTHVFAQSNSRCGSNIAKFGATEVKLRVYFKIK